MLTTMQEMKHFYFATGGNVNWYAFLVKQFGTKIQVLKMFTNTNLAIPLLRIYL